jgi:Xaa-Pro aminopeptidase
MINGYFYLPKEGKPVLFVKRPTGITGENVFYIRKPEQITEILAENGISLPKTILLETGELPYNDIIRLQTAFRPEKTGDGTALIRKVRSIKTPYEIEQFRISARLHAEAYRQFPALYRSGMTDLEFSVEIERVMRLKGSLGVFRAFGEGMDIFMGSVLAGDNAGAASPFDFALGGEGLDQSIPVGANGTRLQPGMTVMVDMGGTFTAYMTDMTRVYSIGKTSDEACKAHQVSIEMHEALMQTAKPGTICEDLYNMSISMAEKHHLSDKFMGIEQQAKFVGHGIGIEVNELPVLAPRFNTPLEPGMVFAYEPKFIIPHVGAVGIENSYLVTENGIEKLTVFEENIISL